MEANICKMTRPRAAIITALALEATAVERHLGDTREATQKGTIYRLGTFRGKLLWDVALVQVGMHNVPAAAETERAIAFFNPIVCMIVGVAGGLKDVKLGDVIAGTKAYSYEAGKDETAFKPRPEVAQSSYGLVQRANIVAREAKWISRILGDTSVEPPSAYVGPIASGEKVVGAHSSATFGLLRQHYSDALATEMEGYGFLLAATMNQPVQALAVRGISDLIDKKDAADESGSQPRAANHAAAFAMEVLASLNFGREPHSIPSREWFRNLENVAIRLFSGGPNDRQIWSRAGGNPALLEIERNAVAAWHSAVRTLELGGGGTDISPTSLVAAMLEEFPRNPELLDLIAQG